MIEFLTIFVANTLGFVIGWLLGWYVIPYLVELVKKEGT